jgi:hypothetical protein
MSLLEERAIDMDVLGKRKIPSNYFSFHSLSPTPLRCDFASNIKGMLLTYGANDMPDNLVQRFSEGFHSHRLISPNLKPATITVPVLMEYPPPSI